MAIILYDIPSTLPEKAFSPNTWKARFCLNYKGLPYKTEWVELVDVQAHCKKLGIAPTTTKPDGSPFYTLPAIHDPSTGVTIADSFAIAEYLEKTYPTPSLFPHNTIVIQSIFDGAFSGAALKSLGGFVILSGTSRLGPESAAYFRRTREKVFGKALEDVPPKGDEEVAEWAALKAGWGTVDAWYKKGGGPFVLGDTVSWADFVIASRLIWLRAIWGEESQKWKDIASWHGGRWVKVLDDLKEYQKID